MFKINLMPPHGRQPWNDNGLGQVAVIMISHDSRVINSLRFLYVKGGIFQMSERHGCITGNSRMIKLDYPREFLTVVHGYCCPYKGVVTSITFVTNKATYGPFGEGDTYQDNSFGFQLGSEEGWFNVFHGTVRDGCIGSIGVNIQTPTGSQPQSSVHLELESTSTHSTTHLVG